MPVRPSLAIAAGAIISAAIAFAGAGTSDDEFAARLNNDAEQAIANANAQPVKAQFVSALGMPSRHPVLSGGENLDEQSRDRVAKAVAGLPGVGGVSWSDGTMMAEAGALVLSPLHCQEDVQALLSARTIRFEESSSEIVGTSGALLDEVATALRPCLGSQIAITGHTDASGPEEINLLLSRERALAVRNALMDRGIPADGMAAEGVGSEQPIAGLQPEDPANRRIEFSVVTTQQLVPTPIDTPGPR